MCSNGPTCDDGSVFRGIGGSDSALDQVCFQYESSDTRNAVKDYLPNNILYLNSQNLCLVIVSDNSFPIFVILSDLYSLVYVVNERE